MNTIIITGSTKGIGADIARVFYDQGCFIVVNSRTNNGFADNLGNNAIFVEGDVRKLDTHSLLVKVAIEKTGRIDTYINCAGISMWKPIDEVNEEFLNLMIDINLKSIFWGCRVAAKNLKEGGSIINISSLAGKRGSANNSVYCASKFGVNGLTQSLAKELGPRGIRVNAVCPVYVQTPGLLEALVHPDAPPRGQATSKYLGEFANSNAALQRLPEGNEIADLCFYLASPMASAITGQCINVDCGVLPQ